MSEDLAESLSRFTPDGRGLDRDALLIAAGRASVRPTRRWPAVAGALALCQVLTLVLLWPRPVPTTGVPQAAVTPPRAVETTPPPRPTDPSELGALTRHAVWTGSDDLGPPAAVEAIRPASPPLRASGANLPGTD